MDHGGDDPREGDVALSALLSLHSVAMNGGLLHSVEHHKPDEIEAAVAGYRYFDLNDAAEVIEWVAECVNAVESGSDEAGDLEAEADRRYWEVVPDDSTLEVRFNRVYRSRPEAFAPIR